MEKTMEEVTEQVRDAAYIMDAVSRLSNKLASAQSLLDEARKELEIIKFTF